MLLYGQFKQIKYKDFIVKCSCVNYNKHKSSNTILFIDNSE